MEHELKVSSLRERVGVILRTQIMTGQLVPGTVYSVAQFVESLGVSHTPIREAVLDLAADGLVEIRRNKGFVIPDVSVAELEELHKIRLLLEVPATVDAGRKMSADEVREARRLAQETLATAHSDDLVAYIESDRRFHTAFLQPLRMPKLVDLIMSFRDKVRLRALPAVLGSDEVVAASHDHLEMVDLAESKAFESLEVTITRHIENTRRHWWSPEQ